MDWTSFYCAPVVFAVMLPFWFLVGVAQFRVIGRSTWREALLFASWYSPAASLAVWLTLYALPGFAWGQYAW